MQGGPANTGGLGHIGKGSGGFRRKDSKARFDYGCFCFTHHDT
jgi:hypothetical protein